MFIIFKRYEVFIVGITIASLTGDNGLIGKSGEAKNATEKSQEKEELEVAVIRFTDKRGNLDATKIVNGLNNDVKNLNSVTATDGKFPVKVEYKNGHKYQITKDGDIMISVNAGDTAPTDSNAMYSSGDYTAVIPAGFTVSNVTGESSIETGLVIRDDLGNEFVWIPVGIPWKSDSTKTITLGRYEFKIADDSTAGTILQTKTDGMAIRPSGYTCDFTEDIKNNTGKGPNGNAIAKDIEDFKIKTNAAGGFWIGRYEARVEGYTGSVVTSNSNKETSWTGYTGGKLVEKPGAQVFNYITQNKASELSKTMYSSDYFESDLINSYAWDTATLFFQEYDNRADAVKDNSNYKAKYSNQIRLSTGLKNRGTNNLSVEANKDKICNVYDMADNCFEWTTENSSYKGCPCVKRGGRYDSNGCCTCTRDVDGTWSTSDLRNSFRPVLYVK